MKTAATRLNHIWIGVLCMVTTSMVQAGTLWLPSIFSEGMVLQREMSVPVWGRAAPGAEIRVSMIAQTGVHFERGADPLADATTTACPESGRWQVTLDPMPAGGRHTLLITAKGPERGVETLRLFSNVLIGEVWVICGQSNMLWPMNVCAERDDALATMHDYPLIRIANVGFRGAHALTDIREEPLGYWGPVRWEEATYKLPRSSRTDVPGSSSSVSYFFARELTRWLGGTVPVGMIEVGAILPVESWMDDAVAADIPELAHLLGRPYPHATGRAFNANIAPLSPYAIRGAIYYQGEMNAGRPADYYHGLKAMIVSWRQAWERSDLPFLIVQLPGFIEHRADATDLDMNDEQLARFHDPNTDHPFSMIREAQRRVSAGMEGVGLAVILDKGEPFDIHPPRKRTVGERLALLARARVYGDADVVGESPRPRTFSREGRRYVIAFENTGGGLHARGALDGFEILDADGIWHPARAELEGDTVSVRAEAVQRPAGVRYAWQGFPPVTLYNAEGLPATPFIYPLPTFAPAVPES